MHAFSCLPFHESYGLQSGLFFISICLLGAHCPRESNTHWNHFESFNWHQRILEQCLKLLTPVSKMPDMESWPSADAVLGFVCLFVFKWPCGTSLDTEEIIPFCTDTGTLHRSFPLIKRNRNYQELYFCLAHCMIRIQVTTALECYSI